MKILLKSIAAEKISRKAQALNITTVPHAKRMKSGCSKHLLMLSFLWSYDAGTATALPSTASCDCQTFRMAIAWNDMQLKIYERCTDLLRNCILVSNSLIRKYCKHKDDK